MPSRSLPARPSLESLRKQAKRLARDIAAGDAAAIARARAQLPDVDLPLTQRNAQLAIAREYGYAGWHDLIAEVSKRLGMGFEWAIAQARRIIHDNHVERLRERASGRYPTTCHTRRVRATSRGSKRGSTNPERLRWALPSATSRTPAHIRRRTIHGTRRPHRRCSTRRWPGR